MDYENLNGIPKARYDIKDRDEIMRELIDIQFIRNDINFDKGYFRVRERYTRNISALSSENTN